MRKLIITFLVFIFYFSTNSVNANHIIEGVIFSSDITEGVKSTITVGNSPFGLAVNSATNKVYACNSNDNTVSIINGSNNVVEGNVIVGSDPRNLAVNLKTNKIYVANYLGKSVSVIDGSTNSVSTTLTVGEKPYGIAVNNVTNKIYVSNEVSNNVSVINGLSNTVITTVNVGTTPQGLAVNSKTNKIYVTNYDSNSVSVIDGATDTVVKTIQGVSSKLLDAAVDESRNKIFIAAGSGTLAVIDGNTDTVTNGFSIGINGTELDFHPTTGKVYVTVTFSDTIEVFDSINLKPLYVLGAILSPVGIANNPETHLIYVTDRTGNTVKVIEDNFIKQNPEPTATASPTPGPGTTATPGTLPTPQATPQGGTGGGSTSTGGGTSELIDILKELINKLSTINTKLINLSRFTRRDANQIQSIIGLLSFALDQPTEAACTENIESAVSKIFQTSSTLDKKTCSARKKRRCIKSSSSFEEIKDEVFEAFELGDSIRDADENRNFILDICEVI